MSKAAGPSDEYARFLATFFQECAELLADAEQRIARLQEGQVDRDELDAVFRAVHSIKAGAGAFGFTQLVTFTHGLEAVLDRLRSGTIEQTPAIATLLVRACDVLAVLVDTAQHGGPVAPDHGADVAADLTALLGENPSSTLHAPSGTDGVESMSNAPHVFRITFRPHAELFRHANEPLLLLRELRRLGTLEIDCDLSRLPSLMDMDPESAYLGWTLNLSTRHSRADILDIFEFVDQDCDLTIEAQAGDDINPASSGYEAEKALVPSAPIPSAPIPLAPIPLAPIPLAPKTSVAGSAPSIAGDVDQAAGQPREAIAASAAGARGASAASIRVELARIDRLVNMVGELVITQTMLAQQIEDSRQGQGANSIQGHEDLAVLTRELQDCVMAIRMQPVRSVFQRMPRLVREVCAKLGKDVRIVMTGEQTEVDKTVIEELADPLVHMIRNAIDHGIEPGAARKAAGKPEQGTIELSASHVGSNIVIHVADDGAGLSRARLRQKAAEKGIIPTGSSLSDEETDDLIFAPGFSTAKSVTDVSGRGVGMDVVRRNITNLGGRIHVQSVEGRGTRFTLTIPLTLAVLDGMVVAVGREKYILPLTSIVECFRPDHKAIRGLQGGREVVGIRGDYIPLVLLYKVFDVPGAVGDPAQGLVVVIETSAGARVGLVVDELVGQQQVVIKSLTENFDPVAGISGATILGNGKVALILDIEQIASISDGARPTSRPRLALPPPRAALPAAEFSPA